MGTESVVGEDIFQTIHGMDLRQIHCLLFVIVLHGQVCNLVEIAHNLAE